MESTQLKSTSSRFSPTAGRRRTESSVRKEPVADGTSLAALEGDLKAFHELPGSEQFLDRLILSIMRGRLEAAVKSVREFYETVHRVDLIDENTHVSQLPLDNRIIDSLERGGFVKVGAIVRARDEELTRCKSFGPVALRQVRALVEPVARQLGKSSDRLVQRMEDLIDQESERLAEVD